MIVKSSQTFVRSSTWYRPAIRAANESTLMIIIGLLECSDSSVDKTEVPWEDRIKKLELRFPGLIVGDRDYFDNQIEKLEAAKVA